jgi:hypothetical protein
MADSDRDFFADLERQLVGATRTDNRRRRRRRAMRTVTPAVAVAGVAAVALGALPGGSAERNPLMGVANAAQAEVPQWASAEIWRYGLDTSVSDAGATTTASYELTTVQRSGDRAEFAGQRADGLGVAQDPHALAATFEDVRSGVVASRTQRDSVAEKAFDELPVPADAFPTTVDGVSRLVGASSYGTTCGEKAMHLAKDVLRVPGVPSASRRAMVLALGQCPGVRVNDDARDAIGRAGTAITVSGDGSGVPQTTELVLGGASSEPLSMVQRAAFDAPKLGIKAGDVVDADVYRYSEK